MGDNDNDLDVTSTPLGDDDVVIAQENVAGKDNIRGGGEFPDPDTPPDESLGAPGDDLDEVRARDNTSS